MMEIDDKKPNIDEILRDAETDMEQDTVDEEPDFIIRARVEARERGVHVEVVLREQALEMLRNAAYPTPACLTSYELELLSQRETLGADRASHAETCIPCRRHMSAANSKAQAKILKS